MKRLQLTPWQPVGVLQSSALPSSQSISGPPDPQKMALAAHAVRVSLTTFEMRPRPDNPLWQPEVAERLCDGKVLTYFKACRVIAIKKQIFVFSTRDGGVAGSKRMLSLQPRIEPRSQTPNTSLKL